MQYHVLFEGRENDVAGVGYARGVFSDNASGNFPADYESLIEAYYNASIAPWLKVGPGIQYVKNPGGSGTTGDAVIVSLRAGITF